MKPEFDALEIVTKKLDALDIPYMLTGSFASNYYSIPRMTRDIDIVIKIGLSDAQTLLNCFTPEFYIDEEMIKDAIKHTGMFNIIANNTIVKVDFIIQKKTAFHIGEFSRRRRVKMGHFELWIASPEDLILAKLQWAKESSSETQLRDIRNMLNAGITLDFSYINRWIKELDLHDQYNLVSSHA